MTSLGLVLEQTNKSILNGDAEDIINNQLWPCFMKNIFRSELIFSYSLNDIGKIFSRAADIDFWVRGFMIQHLTKL